MPANVGTVEAVLRAKDEFSPILVTAAERVKSLSASLEALGQTTGPVYDKLKTSLTEAEARFKSLSAASDVLSHSFKDNEEATKTHVSSFEQLEGMAGRLAARLAILYAIRGTFQFVEGLFEGADAFVRLNSETNLSITKLQAIKYVTEEQGLKFDTVASSIKTLDRNLAEMRPAAVDAIGDLGLSLGKLFQMSPDDRFNAIVEAIAKLPNQMQRTNAEAKLGIEPLDALIKSWEELKERSKDVNTALSEDQVRALAVSAKAWRDLKSDVNIVASDMLDRMQQIVAYAATHTFGFIGAAGQDLHDIFNASSDHPPTTNGLLSDSSPVLPSRDIGTGTNVNAPTLGWDYINMLRSQSLAVRSLTADQRAQLMVLNDLNELTLVNAVHVRDSATGVVVTSEQFKGFTAQLKENEAALKKAATAEAAYQKANDDLNSTGINYKATLAGIDDSIISLGKSYLTGGGASALHDMEIVFAHDYGLTALQVKAIADAWADENKAQKKADEDTQKSIIETEKLWDQYDSFVAKSSEGSTAKRIADVDTWYNHEVAITKADDANKMKRLDALDALAAAKKQDILKQDEEAEKQSAERLLVLWDQYYQAVEDDSGTELNVKLANIQRQEDAAIKSIKQEDIYRQQDLDAIRATAAARITAVIHSYDPLWLAWRNGNEDMRKEYASVWESILGGTSSYVKALTTPFTDLQTQFRKMLAGMLADWEQQLLSPILMTARNVFSQMLGLPGASSATAGAVGLGGLFAPDISKLNEGGFSTTYTAGAVDSMGNPAGLASTQYGGFSTLPQGLSSAAFGSGNQQLGRILGGAATGAVIGGAVGGGDTGSQIGGAIGGAAGMVIGNALAGPVGGFIASAILGGIGGLIGGAFGDSASEQIQKQKEQEAKQTRDQYLSQFSPTYSRSQHFLGPETVTSDNGYASMLATITPQLLDVGLTADQAHASLQAMMDAKTPEDFARALQTVNSLLDLNKGISDEVQGIVQGISKEWSGHAMSEAMKQQIRDLAQMKGLTEDERQALLNLTKDVRPDFESLGKRAAEFGLTMADLGPKFEQGSLEDRFGKLFQLITDLDRGGADVAGMMHGLKGSVNDLVHESELFGTKIPENMKPWLQLLVDGGELTHKDGTKVKDLSELSFEGTPLDASTQIIKGAMDHLASTLERLPRLIEAIMLKAAGNPFAQWGIDASITPGGGFVEDPNNPNMFHGGTTDVNPAPGSTPPDPHARYMAAGLAARAANTNAINNGMPSAQADILYPVPNGFATEAFVRSPTLAMIGDVPGGEFVLKPTTIVSWLNAASTAGAKSSGSSDPAILAILTRIDANQNMMAMSMHRAVIEAAKIAAA